MARQPRDMEEIQPSTPIENDLSGVEQSILSEFDASDESVAWDVRVYRIDKSAGNAEEYLFSVTPDELDGLLPRVRDSEGTGHYRMRAYRKQGKDKKIFAAHDFRVRAPNKPSFPQQERQSDMAVVLQAIERQNQNIVSLFEKFMHPNAQPVPSLPADPFAGIEKIAQVMQTISAMSQPKTDPALGTIDAVLKGVELASKIRGDSDEGGGDGGEVSMMGLLRDFLRAPFGQKIVENILTAQQAPTGTVRPPPQPEMLKSPNQTQVPPTPQQEQDQASEAQKYVRNGVAYLITRAQQNADAEMYAEWVFDNWPKDLLISLTRQPNLLLLLQHEVPEAKAHEAWFKQLVDDLTSMVNDALAAEQPSPDAPGSNAAVHPNGNSRGRGGRESHVAANVQFGEDEEEKPFN